MRTRRGSERTAALAAAMTLIGVTGGTAARAQVAPGAKPGAIPMPGIGRIPQPGLGVLTPPRYVTPPRYITPPSYVVPGTRPTTPAPWPTAPVAGAFAPRGAVTVGPLTGGSGTVTVGAYGAYGTYGNVAATVYPAPPASAFPRTPAVGYHSYNGATYYCAPGGVWYLFQAGTFYPTTTVVVTSPAAPGYAYTDPRAVGTPIEQVGRWGIESTPTHTTVTMSGGTSVTVANGYHYAPAFVIAPSVPSPFGTLYGLPARLNRATVSYTPWPYASGVEAAPLRVWSEEDAYIASDRSRAASLRTALEDLARFWERGDAAALRRVVDPDLAVAVFRDGRFLYALDDASLRSLFEDARTHTSTSSFRFTDVRRRDDGLVTAYARHTFRPAKGGAAMSTTVRCTLAYVGGAWRLSAVAFGASPDATDE